MTEPTPATREVRGSHRAAGLLTLVEALVVLAFAVFYVYEMVTGATDDLTRAATSGVLILLFGVGLLVLARGWARAAVWARTPTLLWNALLLPVAWSLHEADRTLLAVGIGVLAVASIAAAVAAPGRPGPGADGEPGPGAGARSAGGRSEGGRRGDGVS